MNRLTCKVTANSVSFPISSLNWFASLEITKETSTDYKTTEFQVCKSEYLKAIFWGASFEVRRSCFDLQTSMRKYINNSLHLARKYAMIFVRGHYLFREANSFPRAKLEENCELRGTDNVQGQISEHIFAAKLRLLCLLSIGFKNWGISSDIPQF